MLSEEPRVLKEVAPLLAWRLMPVNQELVQPRQMEGTVLIETLISSEAALDARDRPFWDLDGMCTPAENGLHVLDLLIGRPDERFDTAAVAKHLGLSDHKAVARATYAMGQALKAKGYARPWTEAQQGYAMPAETANLLKSVSST